MLEKGERYDLVVMDENFGNDSLMLGSTAIRELRAKLSGGEVIISCRRDCASLSDGQAAPELEGWG